MSTVDEGVPPGRPTGAYGLRLVGVTQSSEFLVAAPASWPTVEIVFIISDRDTGERDGIGEERSVMVPRSGGSVVMERATRRVVITSPVPVHPAALAHPYLTPVGTMFARWDGRESFHAGGIVIDGGVWGLVGERGAGKSSLVAMWAEIGGAAFCDDVLVVSEGTAMAGPRLVDLNRDSAERLGLDVQASTVPGRTKFRRVLDPVPAELPLSGWVFLEWSERLICRRLSASHVLPRLAGQRGILLRPYRPRALLEAAALPSYLLSRPRGWKEVAEVIHLLSGISGR